MIDPMNDLKNKISEAMIPTEEFNAEFKSHVRTAKKAVEMIRCKAFLPQLVLLVIGDDGEREDMIIRIDLPGTHEERKTTMSRVGIIAAANKLRVVMAVFQCEGWMVKRKSKDGITEPPSESPDREEVIAVTASSIDGRNAMASIPIVGRDDDGALILGDADVNEYNDGDVKMRDSILGSFFLGYASALTARLAVNMAIADGREPEPACAALVKLMDACPFKLKST